MTQPNSENVRCYIIKKDGGEVTGHFDLSVTTSSDMEAVKDVLSSLTSVLDGDYTIITGRSPEYDELNDKLDKIVELLKRSLNE